MTLNFKQFISTGILSTAILCTSQVGAELPTELPLTEAEISDAFLVAGAIQRQGIWVLCHDAPNNSGARIETVSDLNSDGYPDAVIMEDGTFCYGHTGMEFALVSKQADGRWRLVAKQTGIPEFLKTRGVGGWPDISVGGPGFCFPVNRWNGKEYQLHRFEYQGKRCKPQR